ncbi:MAG TPA: bifunctional class I SAM-dependent methyltransferase/glycosyltransferase family 2 protein [Xanthobacteraceae bacterium]|nr:bifunctional class I SAM-dependent methyltransferase/glycosyltransferase family 2 protein [Xanthobacteraceae bacterium]
MSIVQSAPPLLSPRKEAIRSRSDAAAPERARWRRRAAFFHGEDLHYLKFLIPEGARVLEVGCCTGDLLAELKPSFGVGVDISAASIDVARRAYPNLSFYVGDIEAPDLVRSLPGPFDYIVIVDTMGSLDDCQNLFESLHALCTRETRLIVGYYSHLWYPLLKLAEATGLKMPQPPQNVLAPADVAALAGLADFETMTSELRLLSPMRLFGLGRLLNRFLAPLPLLNSLCLRHYTVCRSLRRRGEPPRTASIVIPARNEHGNIAAAVRRMPQFAEAQQIIFVEGHSRDDTWNEIERVITDNPQLDIKALRQPGKGKADAVYTGFDAASGDVLMILDADLTMPPEQLPKFWEAIRSGKGEFVNGTRLVYPLENDAMRFLNLIANKLFSYAFSWLLGQRFTDTLCGTKVLRRSDYERLKAGRSYFGDFDPFGDFDLIFGASKLSLKIVEVPIRYASRTYGETQISRFRHGLLLLRMVGFAFLRIKAQ